MKRYFLLTCLSFFLLIGGNFLWIRAVAFPTKLKPVNGDSISEILVPDWERMSFSQFPPIDSSGSVKVNGETRSWSKGQTPDQYLWMGDIDELRPDLLTLTAIERETGKDQSQTSLAQFPLAGSQSVNRLASVVPGLGNRRVKDIPPLKALFIDQGARSNINQTVKVAASDPHLGQLTLKQINLSPYAIASIPNLDQVPLGQFEQWQKAYLKDVAGLKNLPLAAYPVPPIEAGDLVARIDAVWGTAERQRGRTVSGGYNVGFEVSCSGQACPYIELDDLEDQGRNYRGSFEGKSWISGKYQKVSGGSGCLKGVNGGKEPTGRHPYGKVFKVSVENPDEASNTVDTALYFRFKSWCGATPYFIGPVPFLDYKVNNGIFLGLSERASGDMVGISKRTSPASPTVSQSTQEEEVEVKLLAKAIARISEGSYEDVSPVVSDGERKGRLLGRYGFHSNDSLVEETVEAMEGGKEWLNSLARGNAAEKMEQYFSVAVQEQILKTLLSRKLEQAQTEIDPQTGESFVGRRLIERVAQKYAFGDRAPIDAQVTGIEGISIQAYGEKVKDNYQALK